MSKMTSYHPQSKRKVEILHRRLKEALMCHDKWMTALPAMLLGLRATPRDNIMGYQEQK